MPKLVIRGETFEERAKNYKELIECMINEVTDVLEDFRKYIETQGKQKKPTIPRMQRLLKEAKTNVIYGESPVKEDEVPA
jgi:hypothetical protein